MHVFGLFCTYRPIVWTLMHATGALPGSADGKGMPAEVRAEPCNRLHSPGAGGFPAGAGGCLAGVDLVHLKGVYQVHLVWL